MQENIGEDEQKVGRHKWAGKKAKWWEKLLLLVLLIQEDKDEVANPY